ncbi:hypothetical protein D3C79_935980 [compost metagenome]
MLIIFLLKKFGGRPGHKSTPRKYILLLQEITFSKNFDHIQQNLLIALIRLGIRTILYNRVPDTDNY